MGQAALCHHCPQPHPTEGSTHPKNHPTPSPQPHGIKIRARTTPSQPTPQPAAAPYLPWAGAPRAPHSAHGCRDGAVLWDHGAEQLQAGSHTAATSHATPSSSRHRGVPTSPSLTHSQDHSPIQTVPSPTLMSPNPISPSPQAPHIASPHPPAPHHAAPHPQAPNPISKSPNSTSQDPSPTLTPPMPIQTSPSPTPSSPITPAAFEVQGVGCAGHDAG